MNVVYNKYECRWMYNGSSTCMSLKKFRREKTLGEMWAAVIRNINNLLRTAWLRTRGPGLGTEPESVDAQKGTMLDVFARCLKKEIAQVRTLPSNVQNQWEAHSQNHPYCYASINWRISKHSGYIVMQQPVTEPQMASWVFSFICASELFVW